MRGGLTLKSVCGVRGTGNLPNAKYGPTDGVKHLGYAPNRDLIRLWHAGDAQANIARMESDSTLVNAVDADCTRSDRRINEIHTLATTRTRRRSKNVTPRWSARAAVDRLAENVGFLTTLLRRFDRRHAIAPDSAKNV